MKSLFPPLLVAATLQLAPCNAPLYAQNSRPAQPGGAPVNQLPVLQAEPTSLGPNTVVTLRLTSNFPGPNPRMRVGLFEAGRPVMLADTLRDWVQGNGSYQTSLTIQGDPGAYELRIVSNDKVHNALSQPAPLLIPGVRREAGWWLLNDTPFFSDVRSLPNDVNSPNAATTGPLFVPSLKRDLGRKSKAQPRNIFTSAPLSWNVVKLPSLLPVAANGTPVDWRASVADALRTAQGSGVRNYLGFELPVAGARSNSLLSMADAGLMKQIRQTVESQAPEAVLMLGVEVHDNDSAEAAVEAINTYGAWCDAVLIYADDTSKSTWPVKAARRMAEEQSGYDLPIFVQQRNPLETVGNDDFSSSQAALDYFMSGATGLLGLNETQSRWHQVVSRNLPLFLSSVTLEDIGILPLPESLGAGDAATTQLYRTLRVAGRVPQVARTLSQKEQKEFARVPESFCVALGDRISDATVEQFKATVKAGATIYLEGAPLSDERGQPAWKLASLVGATATAVTLRQATMTLEDPWTWGAGHGAQVRVQQDVQVKLSPNSLAKPPKPERGKDVLTGPRVEARLEDGSPGVIVTPLGKGEVIWMPYHLLSEEGERTGRNAETVTNTASEPTTAPAVNTTPGVKTALATPRTPDAVLPNINRATPLQRYYAAIAGYLQQSLVHLRGMDARQAGAEAIRVAVRRSPKNTLLVALFNTSRQPAAIGASVGGAPGVALDLAEDNDLPLTVRGYQSEAAITIPAGGWKLLAFAESRKALEDERNAPHLQARLR